MQTFVIQLLFLGSMVPHGFWRKTHENQNRKEHILGKLGQTRGKLSGKTGVCLNKQGGFGAGAGGQDGRESHHFINPISHGLGVHVHIFQPSTTGHELEVTNLLGFLKHI